jgi:uncharacterized protein
MGFRLEAMEVNIMLDSPVYSKIQDNIPLDNEAIADFCTRWKIVEMAVFGSVIRDDFTPESDVDVLITLSPKAEWDLFDWIQMRDELAGIFGRKVDLAEKSTLRNPFRRKEILANHEIIYVS